MFVTQKLIDPKGEIDKFSVTVGVLNTPFSVTDKLSRESARMEFFWAVLSFSLI